MRGFLPFFLCRKAFAFEWIFASLFTWEKRTAYTTVSVVIYQEIFGAFLPGFYRRFCGDYLLLFEGGFLACFLAEIQAFFTVENRVISEQGGA